MRCLGIDPGLNTTGFGCVEQDGAGPDLRLVDGGVIRLTRVGRGEDARAESVAARLIELERDLAGLIGELRPDAIVVEEVFAHRAHPATSIVMGHARGVVLLTARKAGVRLIEYKPTAIKKAVTGNGHASKGQIQEAVRGILGLAAAPSQADMADAIAMAVCGVWREGACAESLT
jgi:crossover junction endodeoxyribonuclease RuvC